MTESILPQKVTDLWLSDGNLIIIAGPKVFRLYQGLLARRSSIFNDILSIPQPDPCRYIDAADDRILQAIGEDVRGCAVVRLTDDPQEVEWFLSAFFGDNLASSSRGKSQYTSNLAALSGILRLAAKYDVSFLQSWAVSWMENCFPSDIDSLRKDISTYYSPRPSIDGYLSLINLALTVDVPWILPRVYWRLHHTRLVDIMSHHEWTCLPEACRATVLLGREAVREDAVSDLSAILRKYTQEISDHPPGAKECGAKEFMMAELLKDGTKGYYAGGEHTISGMLASRAQRYIMCHDCRGKYNAGRAKLMTDTFLSVQKHYGLPSADILDIMRRQYHEEAAV